MKNLIKLQLKHLLTPRLFATGIIFALFTFANFFIRLQFFSMTNVSLSLFFSAVPYICILVIPSLCAKTSLSVYDDFIPLSYFEKNISRFCALLIVFAFYLLILLPAVFFINAFFSVDAGQLVLSLLFLIFYVACIISLCLFISELIPNQIFAFVISALVLAVFNSAHNFTVYFSSAGFLSSFFKSLSFAWHFDAASKGIFDTRDFIFFSVFTMLFLLLSFLRSEVRKGRRFNKKQKIRVFLYFFILIMLFLNACRFYVRLDFSKSKSYSLSKYSKTLLKQIDQPLSITFYRSKTLSRFYPQIRDVSDFLNIYAMQSKNINFRIQNPDGNQKTAELLSAYGIKSQQIRNSSGNSTNISEVYSAIILEYNGIFEAIPFVISSDTLEYDLDVRLNSLLAEKKLTVNLILGNGMSYSEDYTYLVPLFNSQGIECNPIFIQDPEFERRLDSAKGPLFVIGDSQIGIENAVAIENYILSGKGNAFFAVSPYSVDISGDWSLKQNLNTNIIEILENWGVKFEPALAGDISCQKITLVSGEETSPFEDPYTKVLNYPLWIKLLPQINAPEGLSLFWTTPLTITDEKLARPYLASTSAGFSYKISDIDTNPFSLSEKSFPSDKGSQILGAEISGELKGLFTVQSYDGAKIIVVPDQYFLNTLMNNYSNAQNTASAGAFEGSAGDFSNFDFAVNQMLYLMGEEELRNLQSRHILLKNYLKINEVSDFQAMARLTLFFVFIVVPLFVAALCVLWTLYLKRRRKAFCASLNTKGSSK